MPNTKSTPAKKAAKKAAPRKEAAIDKTPPSTYRARVRMYRQGLGDCFLLTFPRADGKSTHVMIDCGVVLGTSDPATIMKKVAGNLFTETNGNIDVLVITHEHWDHVSAFTKGQAQKEFDDFNFDQLWLAWTEDPRNDLANALRSERELKKQAVAATSKKLSKIKADGKAVARMNALMGFFGVADTTGDGGAGKGGTKEALDYLKNKVKRQQTFSPGGKPIPVPGVDDVRVYVLGPPEDRAMLRKTNPGKANGYGLSSTQLGLSSAFAAALGIEQTSGDAEMCMPFPPAIRKKSPHPSLKELCTSDSDWRSIENDWLSVGEHLALQLDSDTNNTSLVLAFEFIKSQEVLFFVGDAQAGNWLSWDDLKWQVKDKDGEKQEVTAEDLLNRTVLYKVGHHGSHNATLREKGLERMTDSRLVALLPVDEQVAHEKKHWNNMPLPDLCDRLKEKCAAFARIDSGIVPTKAGGDAELYVKDLYIDYYLK